MNRWQASLAKNWAESDTLRAQLAEQGWLVKDGKAKSIDWETAKQQIKDAVS